MTNLLSCDRPSKDTLTSGIDGRHQELRIRLKIALDQQDIINSRLNQKDEYDQVVRSQYFSAEIAVNGDYNKTTKVLMAMISYLQNLQARGQADGDDNEIRDDDQVNENTDHRKETPFSISIGRHSNKSQIERIQRLRQVATRLVHKIEERLRGEENPSKELEETIEKANDLMIDTIAEVEQTVPRRNTRLQHRSNDNIRQTC